MSGSQDLLRDWRGWSLWERSGAVFIVLLLVAAPGTMFLIVSAY